MDVDIVDGRGQDENTIQLTHPAGRQFHPDAVEEGVFQIAVRSVDSDVEDGPWRGGEPSRITQVGL